MSFPLSRLKRWLPVLVVLVLVVPALPPLWQAGLQQTDDGAHHVFRLFNLDAAVRAGHVGTRWLADEGFGYGFPVFNFYPLLSYVPGLVLHWLGMGFASAFEWTLGVGFFAAALAMYALARNVFGAWGGALAAVAYTWAPYHLADAWTRGALAEHLTFLWLPLVLLALWHVSRALRRAEPALLPALWGCAAFVGLLLTHHLSVILVAPLVLICAAFLLRQAASRQQRLRVAALLFVMFGLAALITAVFWLPVLTEMKFVLAGHVQTDASAWSAGVLPSVTNLVAEQWSHLYTLAQQPHTLHPLGQAQALLALLGLLVGVARWRTLSSAQRGFLALAVGLLCVVLFMQSSLSSAVWTRVPALQVLQFPWRWQILAALSTALLTGFLVFLVPSWRKASVKNAVFVIVLAVLLMSSALPLLPWEPAHVPTQESLLTDANVDFSTLALYDFGRGLWVREHGNPWMFEYMPVDALPRRGDFFLSAGPAASVDPPLSAEIVAGQQTPLTRAFRVNSPVTWTLQLHQFYFPGWEARVDGVAQPAQPTGALALVGVAVPPGTHTVEFRFVDTPIRRVGAALSFAGLLAWLVLVGFVARTAPHERRLIARAAVIALLAVAVVLGTGWRAHAVNSVEWTPTPTKFRFGDEALLVGFRVDGLAQNIDREALVTLTWLALRRPSADYKVFVHLLDAQGNVWAQHDGEPGFFFSPTTRWQAGEVLDDRHVLAFDAWPPRGRYQLRVGMYDARTGTPLPATAADGSALGTDVLLGEIDLGK